MRRRSLPLFVLHDFDVAGFMIFGTLHRDTRRYQFGSYIEPIDLGLRLEDIDGLEQEPAAATKTSGKHSRRAIGPERRNRRGNRNPAH